MSTLICGSLAYDTIMVFRDRFKNHILPDRIHILNVAFLVPDMRREFGGCAGNIAYNLKMLGGEALIMATVGDDFGPYEQRLDSLGLARTHVRHTPGTYTAQAFITTDLDDNQITAFHPGAMNHSHANRIDETRGVELAIVAPDGREGMLQHAQQLHDQGIPFMFDPGQGLPMFDGTELLKFIELADYVAVNDYEGQLLQQRIGKNIEQLAKLVKTFVVTLGARGSVIHHSGGCIEIPCAKVTRLVDPTGCGDAFRAGLLYGIVSNMDWALTGRLASLMGAIKIAESGAQNHRASRDEIGQRFFESFGMRL
ncbi:MAG: carbohydrate kinase family protein [Burkholderiales bacterium]